MKNKSEVQQEKREAHRQQLKTARRKGSLATRSEVVVPLKPKLLIVCEGQNTEPSYFKQFRLSSAEIVAVGTGFNTVSLVNEAIRLSNLKEYDETWCVFDKDDFTAHNFNNAIRLAEGNNLKVAYSNQAFEYWLILHFIDHQGGGMHRWNYNDKINECLKAYGVGYDGKNSKLVSSDLFDIMMAKDPTTKKRCVHLAIERARRNYDQLNHISPAKEESSTTVFKLVQKILEHI